MRSSIFFLILSSVSQPLSCTAAPTPTRAGRDEVAKRRLLGAAGGAVGGLLGVVGTALSDLNNLGSTATGAEGYSSALNLLQSVTPTATPTALEPQTAVLSSIFQATPTPNNLYAAAGQLVAAGLTTDNVESALSFVDGLLDGENSEQNLNPINPSKPIYPKASPSDAPYDLTEQQLREVIYIPPTFQYGKSGAPQPIILVPGTGDTGYTTFVGNYIPLLTGSDVGDPVWLNIPGYLLNDAQTNAEYVAYAINCKSSNITALWIFADTVSQMSPASATTAKWPSLLGRKATSTPIGRTSTGHLLGAKPQITSPSRRTTTGPSPQTSSLLASEMDSWT